MGQLSSKQASQRRLYTRSTSLPPELDGFKRNDLNSSANKSTRRKLIKETSTRIEQMKNQLSTKPVSIEEIDRFQEILASYSQQLATKKQSDEISNTQKEISSLMRQLIIEKERKLDAASVNTNSFSRVPKGRRNEASNNKKNHLSLRLGDIENKFDSLHVDIVMATENKNSAQLRSILESINNLMTDLQILDIKPESVENAKKANLEKKLIRTYKKTEKLKTEIVRESIEDFKKDEETEKEEEITRKLDVIEKDVCNFKLPDPNENDFKIIEKSKELIANLQSKLKSIEEISRGIQARKVALHNKIQDHENAMSKIEAMSKLYQVDKNIHSLKVDLNKDVKILLEVYNSFKLYINNLQNYVKNISELDQEIVDKKQTMLAEIDASLSLLNKKFEEQNQQEQVVLRRNKGFTPFNKFVANFEEFTKTFEPDDNVDNLKHIHKTLNRIKSSISEKLVTIENKLRSQNVDNQCLPAVRQPNENIIQLENMDEEVKKLISTIEGRNVEKYSQDYKLMKIELDSYKKTLNRFSIYRNDNIKKFSEKIMRDVEYALQALESKPSRRLSNSSVRSIGRRSTTENSLNEIMSVSTRISDLSVRINGVKLLTEQDYSNIKTSLLENIEYLKSMQVSFNSNISRSRDEVLSEANNQLTRLEGLMKNIKENRNSSSGNERQLNQKLHNLKDKVSRFSGTYKNVLYNKLEGDLKTCLVNIDSDVENKETASRMKSDIEYNLKILEQKSSKDREYARVEQRSVEESIRLAKIKTEIENVVTELNLPTPKTRKDLEILDGRLTLSIMDLDSLNASDDKIVRETKKLHDEIQRYFSYIQEQINLINQPSQRIVVTAPNPADSIKSDIQFKPADELRSIEENLEIIRPKVDDFVGLETSEEFFELDESLIQSTLKLDKFKFAKGDALQARKVRILKDIDVLSELLDERVKETELIENAETQVKEMIMKIDSLSDFFSDDEYNRLDEQLINIKVALLKASVNEILKLRKNSCIQDVDNCFKRLSEAANNRNRFRGTLV